MEPHSRTPYTTREGKDAHIMLTPEVVAALKWLGSPHVVAARDRDVIARLRVVSGDLDKCGLTYHEQADVYRRVANISIDDFESYQRLLDEGE